MYIEQCNDIISGMKYVPLEYAHVPIIHIRMLTVLIRMFTTKLTF